MRSEPGGDAGGRRSSLEDVARLAGVSLATASRVLNGNGVVRAESRARVERAATALGYRANTAAQAIARGYANTVAIIVADVRDGESSAIANGAIGAAAANAMIGTVIGLGTVAHVVEAIRDVRAQRPRALVIEVSAVEHPTLREAIVAELVAHDASGGRVVLVGQSALPFATSSVDQVAAGRGLAQALIEIGYARPLLLRAPVPASLRRMSGTIECFRAAGFADGARVVDLDRVGRQRAEFAVETLSDRQLRGHDVIICADDDSAIGVMNALRRRGVDPGPEIGITGFGRTDYADDVRPRLTTVDTFPRALGRRAVEFALAVPLSPLPVETGWLVRVAESTPLRRHASS